ncbi:MAG TPA: phytoene/squalene synthase family protein [Jatrophihabitans sp.]|nr:phytoene/squalene synthase family protein [Jatrophihabitans sp.]
MDRRVRQELAAAGIAEPGLRSAYLLARRLNARHGKTYFLATLLLPPAKRPHVHALYGFARYADDIVDELSADAEDRARRFARWSESMLADLAAGRSADPICRALLHTIDTWQLPRSYFADFLHSMHSDLVVTSYPSYAELARYMWGSAAVIGLQMLPILGQAEEDMPPEQLRRPAADLGLAFQLTNFIRDVGEDLDRGRIYLPLASLAEFGVDPAQLRAARASRVVDRPIRRLIRFEIERARSLYDSAEPGIELVHPTSRDCLRTAFTLYRDILVRIEQAGYNVFAGRASVPLGRRARVAGVGLVRARQARARYA